jgi:signal transduction histidine kinase
MILRRTLDHLLPKSEREPKFREYVLRLSASALQTLAIVDIASSVVLYAGRMAAGRPDLKQALALLLVGLATLGASRMSWPQRNARPVAAISAWLGPALLMLAPVDDLTLTAVMLMLVSAAATVPFLPWHALTLGAAVECVYILSSSRAFSSPGDVSAAPHIDLALVAILATGIAASNHAHRAREFAHQQNDVRLAETLTGAQLRAQLAESAISIGKMAAAISHEINSPLGALRSSVETLCALTDRQLASPMQDRERLAETRAQLHRSIDDSAARIDEVARRLRRFVSLEEAETKSADLNDLLTDVTLLHRDEIDGARVNLEFDLEKALPPLNCRPQLLTAAFSTFLSNAIQAVNGDGNIAIQTRDRGGEVEVTIRDNGRGMSAEEAETIFDPSFKVADNRVSSGNWSLFNSRQIVYEHGGEIRLESAPGQGTAMHIKLPVV